MKNEVREQRDHERSYVRNRCHVDERQVLEGSVYANNHEVPLKDTGYQVFNILALGGSAEVVRDAPIHDKEE